MRRCQCFDGGSERRQQLFRSRLTRIGEASREPV
jgi:hypothetical protein